jgi:oligopeptide/dipeptide ABC transporter ATP-binding protein
MYVGKTSEIGETDNVLKNPLHPYTEALISAVPPADPGIHQQRILLEGDVPSPANPPPGCVFHPRCAYADAICSQKEPELREVKGGHFATCHFADTLQLKGIKEV